MNDYKSDIDLTTAINAHRGTSFSSEKRGASFVNDYDGHLKWTLEWLNQWRTDENSADIDEAFAYYREGYKKRALAYLYAHSRCISSFITGPSGFPVERARKANASADKRLTEWLEWSHKQRERTRRKFDPKAPTVISADDEDAIAKLAAKRDRLQQRQEAYKAANKVARSKKLDEEQKRQQLLDLGFDEKTVYTCLHPRWGKFGFDSYVLTNNNANIHRISDRIVALQREAERRETTPDEYEINGVKIIENNDENRLQLFFDGKPERSMIDKLKSRGFHWSRTRRCWQRLLNNNARYAMKEILK